jgi:hypothetical protein
MSDEISLGEPSTFYPDDSETFTPARIRHFAESVLSAEAWFRSADELIEAMNVLEPHVKRFWEDVRSISFAIDMTTDLSSKRQVHDVRPKHEKSDVTSRHDLTNQHMMLAGFAIENLCKGYLAGRLSDQQRKNVRATGSLRKFLKSHKLLELVKRTGMRDSKHFRLDTICDTEKFLLERITEVLEWRGRYPSPTSHEGRRPFAQMGSNIDRIKRLLQKIRRHVGARGS